MTMNKDLYDQGFTSTLSHDQMNKYKNIIDERRNICIQGYLLGFFIAVLQIVGNVYMKKQKMSKMSMACIIASTVFVVQYFYYILSPKSDWILLHLDTAEQKEKWLSIYRSMQYNCHISVALGIVAAGALAYSFC
tara:strand:- start:957 stop:1361 length:405 start_codon:yes stop_codon:yes gene_type:complete